VSSVIIGARRLSQLDDNVCAVDVHLSAEELARLDALTQPTFGFPQNMLTMAPGITNGGTTINGVSAPVSIRHAGRRPALLSGWQSARFRRALTDARPAAARRMPALVRIAQYHPGDVGQPRDASAARHRSGQDVHARWPRAVAPDRRPRRPDAAPPCVNTSTLCDELAAP